MSLTETQERIVNTQGNLVVMASAGTGKTYTMVQKIEKEIKKNKNYQVIAAITFTIKAANEIKERLTVDTKEHFIGNNNSFVINEIIKPFLKDILGEEYEIEMDTDYTEKVNTLEEGLNRLKNSKILCSYSDPKRNFIFELALKIVRESKACRLYLQAKYFKIYIDEYQDCDKDMHNFFMYLCDNLNIKMFIVGDDKQSIYMWRGAYPQAFRSIKNKENFKSIFMAENFRSCKQIQNYSNLLCEETRNLYSKTDNKENIILINTNKYQWAEKVLKYIDTSKKCALLRYSRRDAKSCAECLSLKGLKMVNIQNIPISDITTEVVWLYTAIAKIFILDRYTEYDLITESPIETKITIAQLKRVVNNIIDSIENYQLFKDNVEKICKLFGYETENKHIKKLYETIINKEFHALFKINQYKNISITFHSSKGLEYNQVIVFAEDYKLNDEQSIYNHYVAVTRAEEKLIIVNCNSTEFINNLNNILETKDLKLEDIMKIV